jgi:predicted dehydrogenase/threonine dehydrogenase-like Zn-dependent dehydrogenase
MKQVVQNFRTGELKIEELPPPALKAGGVLVQTARSLISAGTERTIVETAQSSLIGKARGRPDLVRQVLDTFRREGFRATYEKVKSRLNQMKALGYSASGKVIAVGSGAEEFRVGDLVACAGAGYASHAEVIYVPKNLCVKLPETVSLESACYTTVGAIALQGIRQSDIRLGESVGVIGLGLVGQLTVQMLKAAGCRVLGIDIDQAACDLAIKSGADLVTGGAEEARKICDAMTDGMGVDAIIITAGTKSSEPVELAGNLARDRARVVVVGLVGMDVPRHIYYGKELDLRLSRSYGPGRYDPEYEEKGNDYPIGYVRWTERRNMDAFLRLVAEGKIKTELLTTHRYEVDRAADAYNLILGRGERYCGVVLEYPMAALPPSPLTATRPIAQARDGELGISFIGAGNFARGVLLPAVKREPRIRLLGVATATGISAKNTASQFGFAYASTSNEQLLEDESAQIIFIATRHDNHAQLAAEALRRGKAVFVEKPLAITEEGLREVASAQTESNGLLMVGYNRRFAPIAQEVKQQLASRAGAMTILYRVNAGQLPAEHWSHDTAEGGGRVIGEVCHFVDFIQFLTDSLPVRVSAEAVPLSSGAGFLDDSVSIIIGMADGSIASIVYAASGDPSVPKERIEIFCGKTVAIIEDFKSGQFTSRGKTKKLGGSSQDKGHSAEISAFFEAARLGANSPISIGSLVATTLCTFAINESSASGTAVRVDPHRFLAS